MSVSRDTATSRDISTDAGFRAWATMIHNALAAVGLVNTTDTGQINLSTVTTPGSNNTYGGYEIWKFNDSNQSGDPIFIRIDYGRAGAATAPSIKVATGTGTDGAGTISGTCLTAESLCTAATAPSGSSELHVACVEGTLVFFESAAIATATTVQCFGIERYRDSSGTVISSGSFRGWHTWTNNGYGAANNTSKERKAAATNTITYAIMGFPTAAGPDSKKRLCPYGADLNYPDIGTVAMKSSEVSAGDGGTCNIYGTSRTFKVLTYPTFSTSSTGGSLIGSNVTMRLAALNE